MFQELTFTIEIKQETRDDLHMRTVKFQVPENGREIETLLKKTVLNFGNLAVTVAVITFASHIWLYLMEDASQADIRWNYFWGLIVFCYLTFLVWVAKSADAVGRRWWLWLFISFALPFVGLIGALIFLSTPKQNKR